MYSLRLLSVQKEGYFIILLGKNWYLKACGPFLRADVCSNSDYNFSHNVLYCINIFPEVNVSDSYCVGVTQYKQRKLCNQITFSSIE